MIFIAIDSEATLKVESFAGRNFRDFASFLGVRESLYPRNRTFTGVRERLLEKSLQMASKKENLTKICHVRESLYPRNLIFTIDVRES